MTISQRTSISLLLFATAVIGLSGCTRLADSRFLGAMADAEQRVQSKAVDGCHHAVTPCGEMNVAPLAAKQ